VTTDATDPAETDRCALKNMKDIETPADVRTLVDAFYEKVNRDELLAPVFNEIAGVDWAAHLPTMYRFWESMLFRTGGYEGAPLPKHAVLPVQQPHFERWLTLFFETVTENFSGPKSERAKSQAVCIADTFARRMGVLTEPAALARIRWPSSPCLSVARPLRAARSSAKDGAR
jgi:hemoglobin